MSESFLAVLLSFSMFKEFIFIAPLDGSSIFLKLIDCYKHIIIWGYDTSRVNIQFDE